jgi:outer membrane protein assembly factor BamA
LGVALNHSSYNIEDVPVSAFLDSIGTNMDMEFDYLHYGPFLDLTLDRLDNIYVPEKGVMASLCGRLIMLGQHDEFPEVVDNAFITMTGRWKNVWPAGQRFDFITDLQAGVNLFNRPSPTYFHILGGAGDYFFNNQRSFLGYRYQEIFVRQFAASGALDFRYQVMPRVYTSLILNAGVYNKNWDDYTEFGILEGWGIKAIWMTPFGPVSGTIHSTFQDPELLGYVSVGFVF